MARQNRENPNLSNILFREGEAGERQRTNYIAFHPRSLQPTRYAHLDSLTKLGILDGVTWMLQRAGIWHLCTNPQPTYEQLTLEFLSSFAYVTSPGDTNQLTGAACFRLFGTEYQVSQDRIADMLQFSHGDDAHRRPSDQFYHEAFILWNHLTGTTAESWETLNATHIYNPTIRYFHLVLSNIIFARDSNHKVNSKELFFLRCVFASEPVDAAPFLLAYIQANCNRDSKPFYEMNNHEKEKPYSLNIDMFLLN